MTNLGLNSAATTLISKHTCPHKKIVIFKKSLLVMMSCVLLFGGVFAALNITGISYAGLLGKIPVNLLGATQKALLVMGAFFFINMPFSLLSSVIVGFQFAYIENIFSLVQVVVSFLSLITVIHLKGDLWNYALLNGLFLLAVNILRVLYFYKFIYTKVDNRASTLYSSDNSDTSYSDILITGRRFLFIGIAAMFVWNTDNLVVSYFLGVSAVSTYSVTLKLYTILYSFIFMVNSSAMSLLAKEFGTGNWEWINKIYSTLLIFSTVIGGLTWLGGVFFARDFIKFWTGDVSLYAGLLTTTALGGYAYLLAATNLNSGVIATFNFTKHAPWAAWLEAGLKRGFSVVLLRWWGLGGVALGSLLGSLFAPTWILPLWLVRRSDHKLTYNIVFIVKHFIGALLLPLVVALLTQHYVGSTGWRIAIGCAGISVYLWICYQIIPTHALGFLKRHVSSVVVKLNPCRSSLINKSLR
jgi:O-antigen/teichoic acid export membrane protein